VWAVSCRAHLAHKWSWVPDHVRIGQGPTRFYLGASRLSDTIVAESSLKAQTVKCPGILVFVGVKYGVGCEGTADVANVQAQLNTKRKVPQLLYCSMSGHFDMTWLIILT
jgi:hypothetical protein